MELRKACFFNLSVILHFDYFIVFDTFSTFIGGEFLFGKFERRRVPLPIHAIGKPSTSYPRPYSLFDMNDSGR